MISLNWRPHTEPPAEAGPMTALIAFREETDEAGTILLLGIYYWKNGKWLREFDEQRDMPETFWWVPELEILPRATA